jgi:hypothetical protein
VVVDNDIAWDLEASREYGFDEGGPPWDPSNCKSAQRCRSVFNCKILISSRADIVSDNQKAYEIDRDVIVAT